MAMLANMPVIATFDDIASAAWTARGSLHGEDLEAIESAVDAEPGRVFKVLGQSTGKFHYMREQIRPDGVRVLSEVGKPPPSAQELVAGVLRGKGLQVHDVYLPDTNGGWAILWDMTDCAVGGEVFEVSQIMHLV